MTAIGMYILVVCAALLIWAGHDTLNNDRGWRRSIGARRPVEELPPLAETLPQRIVRPLRIEECEIPDEPEIEISDDESAVVAQHPENDDYTINIKVAEYWTYRRVIRRVCRDATCDRNHDVLGVDIDLARLVVQCDE
jgi:hypothetical protein